MFSRFVATSFLALTLMGSAALAQVPRVRDQHEYNLILAYQQEKDPAKQMELLKQWEAEYPDSEFKGVRLVSMAQADGQIITRGLLFSGSTADVAAARGAAMDLLNNIDRYLAPENKPPGSTDDQWKQAREQLEERARAVLKL
jgi:hypothetical protein